MDRFSVLRMVKLIVCFVFLVLGTSFSSFINHVSAQGTTNPQSEWVEIPQGNRIVHAYLVHPQGKDKALAVILIHENRGLTEWEMSVADRIGEAGYLAIAVDLLSGMAPNGGKTGDFSSTDAARNAINQLPAAQVIADLKAVAQFARNYEASSGKFTVAGFCWGGGNSFNFATEEPDLTAAFVFYGSPPTSPTVIARINCPVFGFYGGNDSRITSTVPQTEALMSAASKQFEPETYAGAGHAFMRAGEEPGAIAANVNAHDMGWERWLSILGSFQSSMPWAEHLPHDE